MIRPEHLRLLLEKNRSELASECLASLNSGSALIEEETAAVPAKELVHTYSARAKMNEDRQKGIRGFEPVLHRLSVEPNTRFRIALLNEKARKFVVFLREDESEIEGILLIPF